MEGLVFLLAGFLLGILVTLGVIATVGKRHAKRAAEIIDKKIQDAAIHQNI